MPIRFVRKLPPSEFSCLIGYYLPYFLSRLNSRFVLGLLTTGRFLTLGVTRRGAMLND